MAERAIIHVDMDAFFASVEVLDRPELAGKPVIVGGQPEQRGVVASASYQARRYGVRSAMSSWRARQLCPQGILLRPRIRRYAAVSEQILAILREYTPLVEPVSIDEAFLDVTGAKLLFGPAPAIGRAIKRRIRAELKLTASVGIAPNKFLAKLASDLCKPDGFMVIEAGQAPAILADQPVERLWGVGPATAGRLAEIGVRQVRDLLSCPRRLLEERLGAWTGRLLELARGIDEEPVSPGGEPQSIGAETTFPVDIGDQDELCRQLDALVERVGRELREAGYRSRTVHLKARYPDFTTVTRARTLAVATDRTGVLRAEARRLLGERLGRRGRPLRLLGFSVSKLARSGEGQGVLFPDEPEERAGRFERAVDQLHQEFGRDALRPAAGITPRSGARAPRKQARGRPAAEG
jgi:DNA polymerase-4